MRLYWVTGCLFLLGCTSGSIGKIADTGTPTTSAADDTAEDDSDTGNWWEADDDDDGDDDEDTDDEDDEDDEDKPDEETDGWVGLVWPDEGSGFYSYERYQFDGLDCELSYFVDSMASADDCDACSFASSMVLGEMTIELDEGGCDSALGREDETIIYGQGRVSFGEFEGMEYFSLHEQTDGEWRSVDEGWSTRGDVPELEGEVWIFGTK